MWKSLFLFTCLALVGANGVLSSDDYDQQQLAVIHRSKSTYCINLQLRRLTYKCTETDLSKLSTYSRSRNERECPRILRILSTACHQPGPRTDPCGEITSTIQSRGCKRLITNVRRACPWQRAECTRLNSALRTTGCNDLLIRKHRVCNRIG